MKIQVTTEQGTFHIEDVESFELDDKQILYVRGTTPTRADAKVVAIFGDWCNVMEIQ